MISERLVRLEFLPTYRLSDLPPILRMPNQSLHE